MTVTTYILACVADKSRAGEIVQELRKHHTLGGYFRIDEVAHERLLFLTRPRVDAMQIFEAQLACFLFSFSHGTRSSSSASMSARL